MKHVLVFFASAMLASAAYGQAEVINIFDGKSLNSWVVTGCEAQVDNGSLHLKSGDGFVRTAHPYSDFVLELEWINLKKDKFDSGIYIRSEPPKGKQKWPRQYQINLKQDQEGSLIGFKNAQVRKVAKNGEWNQLKLTVKGEMAELLINEKPVWKIDNLKAKSGYIGFQSEVPLGGQFKFKNIRIQELSHKSIFNGKNLDGWEAAKGDAADCWRVENGQILCTGKKGTWLRYREQFGDVNFRLEYKVSPGGNSGIYTRVPKNGNHHGKNAGLEVQILDDSAKKYKKLKDFQYSASLYAIEAVSSRKSRKAGEWNQLEIDAKGQSYRVIHNGFVVIETDEKKSPQLAERLTKGFFGLQNHNTKVWFRRIRVGKSLQN